MDKEHTSGSINTDITTAMDVGQIEHVLNGLGHDGEANEHDKPVPSAQGPREAEAHEHSANYGIHDLEQLYKIMIQLADRFPVIVAAHYLLETKLIVCRCLALIVVLMRSLQGRRMVQFYKF